MSFANSLQVHMPLFVPAAQKHLNVHVSSVLKWNGGQYRVGFRG